MNQSSESIIQRPGFLKTWWVAMRPFALPASTTPVVFGSVLAVTIGQARFDWFLFLGALFGMAFLHTGANILNDVYDYKTDLKAVITPGSGALVRGWLTRRQAFAGAVVFLLLGSAIGLWICSVVGKPILWLGIAGISIGILYSLGPIGFKYNALGDLAVFLDFGVLGALGAWTVQTGSLSWVPAVWAVPMSLLVSGIVHANNWRDIGSDSKGRIRTMASLFGDRGSEIYYGLLLFGPYAVVLAIIAASRLADLGPRMPLTLLITLASLPLAVKLAKRAHLRHSAADPLDFLAMDGATAQLNLLFGVLCTGALLLHALVGACLS